MTTIDFKKLEEGLEHLTGTDFLAAEKRFKTVTQEITVLQISPRYQLELAALALGVNVHELELLPLKQFSKVLRTVATFLNQDSDEEETVAER